MKFRSQRQGETDINITPLIDVVFLLLIFFMVSTTFERESELKITLPEASEEQVETKPDLILVRIDANEQIFIGDKPLANNRISTIGAALNEQSQALTDPPVGIRADAEVSHQTVIKVMDAARQYGLVNITFATRVLEENTAYLGSEYK